MKIIIYPNAILRQKAEAVSEFGSDLQNLIAGMKQVMHREKGIGLAANQVGVAKRVILVEINAEVIGERAKKSGTDYSKQLDQTVPLQALVNPEIVKKSKEMATAKEGCLSLPKIEVLVARAVAVKIKAQNPGGKPVSIAAKGLYARVLQHEIDHLNGILIIDHAAKSKFQNPKIKFEL